MKSYLSILVVMFLILSINNLLSRKISAADQAKMDKVLQEYIKNGENFKCEKVITSKKRIDKRYGKDQYWYLLDECRSYFWGATEDCLYCGQWGGPIGRGYSGVFWVSRFGYLYLAIRGEADKILHRCWKTKYRVKEEMSPIHVVLETEPDEDGGYCIGKELEVEVNEPLKYSKYLNSKYLSLSANVVEGAESKVPRHHFRKMGGRPQGNQADVVQWYEKVFGKLEVDGKKIYKKRIEK